MLNKEEQKAIRNLENLSEFGLSTTLNQTDLDKMKIVLNLITRLKNQNENSISKDIIRDKINERQFELQQEYKDFKDDVKLNTLQELYYYKSKEE